MVYSSRIIILDKGVKMPLAILFNRLRVMKRRKSKLINQEMKAIKNSTFYGIIFNKNISPRLLTEHSKKFKTVEEYEEELNLFATYVFDDGRKVGWHSFRNFPYILHNPECSADYAGETQNYYMSDVRFIKFILTFTMTDGKHLYFPDTQYIKKCSKKYSYTDYPLSDAPIDTIF